MIIVDGDKFSCIQCIRGHRSSTCKHSGRPLVQVRGRGRPAANSGHRIAVTETVEVKVTPNDSRNTQTVTDYVEKEVSVPAVRMAPTPSRPNVVKEVKSCCEKSISPSSINLASAESLSSSSNSLRKKSSCCSSRSRSASSKIEKKKSCCGALPSLCRCSSGAIILKSAKREFVDVKGGHLNFVGPYTEQGMNTFKVNSSSSRSSHNPGPSCCSSKLTPSSIMNITPQMGFKMLKTVILNEVDVPDLVNNQHPHFQPIQPKADMPDMSMQLPTSSSDPLAHQVQPLSYPQSYDISHAQGQLLPYQQFQYQLNSTSEQVYNMYLADGCTMECNCGPNCPCPACLVHRTSAELKQLGLITDSTSVTASTPGSETNNADLKNGLELEQRSERTPQPQTGDLLMFHTMYSTLLEPDCMCPDGACACYNCTKHGIEDGIRLADGVKVADISELNEAFTQQSLGFDAFTIPPDTSGQHDCGCAPDECECYNCVKHGIVNGVHTQTIGSNL